MRTKQNLTKMNRAAVAPLAAALERASREVGSDKRPTIPAINSTLSIRTLLPSMLDDDGHLKHLTPDAVSSEATTLELALLDNARTIQAGASLVVIADPQVVDTGVAPLLQEIPSGLVSIDAAPFAPVADGEDVAESAMPISEALVDRENGGTQYGFRVRIKRKDVKAKGWEAISADLLTSVSAGLARAVDKHLLTAVAASAPSAFTLAAAAASGVRFDQLAALVGTDATGSTVSDAGELRAAGIRAELTADAAATYIADWSHTGVAVHDSIDLLLERTSAAGDLVVTCWLDLHALLPDSGRVWAVA